MGLLTFLYGRVLRLLLHGPGVSTQNIRFAIGSYARRCATAAFTPITDNFVGSIPWLRHWPRSNGAVFLLVNKIKIPSCFTTAHGPISNELPAIEARWLCLSSNSNFPSWREINSTESESGPASKRLPFPPMATVVFAPIDN